MAEGLGTPPCIQENVILGLGGLIEGGAHRIGVSLRTHHKNKMTRVYEHIIKVR